MLIPSYDRHLRSGCPFADVSHAGRLVAATAARRRADRPPVEFWDLADRSAWRGRIVPLMAR